MEGTAHPDNGLNPEALEAKTEQTALDRYQEWKDGKDLEQPVAPEGEAGATGGQKENASEGEPAAKPNPETTETPPRKLKYKANGVEREATEEEAAEALAGHADYMRNIQAVKNREAELQADKALMDAIKTNPAAQKALRDLFLEQEKSAPQQPPTDPIERLAWDIENRILGKIDERIKPLTQGQQAVSGAIQEQRILAGLQAQDPLFNDVYNVGLPLYLKGLPPGMAKHEFERLNRDPEAFLEVYSHVRKHVEAVHKDKASESGAKPDTTTNQATDPGAKERVREEAARRAAPPLESSGSADAGDAEGRQRNAKERAAILTRIKNGQARRDDSLRLMELGR